MATDKAPLHQNRSEDIESWQATAHGGSEATISSGIIATLFDGLMGFLKLMLGSMQNLKTGPAHYRSLENNSAALFFWGRDLGVSQGELDMALQHSSRLRDTVLTILISIGDFMGHGLVRILPKPKEREELLKTSNIIALIENARVALDEPMQSLEYTTHDIEELCSTLQTKIESLSILSSSLECPAEDEFDDEEAPAWVDLQDRSAHEYFVDLISSRFPRAEKNLIKILGQANWDRYNHVQKQREKVQDELEIVDTSKAKSEFYDSGIGSSAPAQSVVIDDYARDTRRTQQEYAATVVSSRAETSHKRLPPLPDEARAGKPFKCEICNRLVMIRRTKEWKKHVFGDICAYTCIFSQCANAGFLFDNRGAMNAHLELRHGINKDTESQTCPLCFEEITGGHDIIYLHFARHMEEIALGVLPRGADPEDGSEGSEGELPQEEVSQDEVSQDELSQDELSQEELSQEESSQEEVFKKRLTPRGGAVSKSQKQSVYRRQTEMHLRSRGGRFLNADDVPAKEDHNDLGDSALASTAKAETTFWQCTFCRARVLPGSWRRHEETQHRPSPLYTCMLDGPSLTLPSSSDPRCAFCMARNPSEEHFRREHRISDCAKRPIPERTFSRPDHLRQHLKNFHMSTLFDNTQSRWKVEVQEANDTNGWTCGFCGTWLGLWYQREMHIANHFKDGMTMEQWTVSPEMVKMQRATLPVQREMASEEDHQKKVDTAAPYHENSNDILQRTLAAAQHARSPPSVSTWPDPEDPFDGFGHFSAGVSTTTQAPKQKLEADSTFAIKQNKALGEEAPPKTISPKDAISDYLEDESTQVTLFPESDASESKWEFDPYAIKQNTALGEEAQPKTISPKDVLLDYREFESNEISSYYWEVMSSERPSFPESNATGHERDKWLLPEHELVELDWEQKGQGRRPGA